MIMLARFKPGRATMQVCSWETSTLRYGRFDVLGVKTGGHNQVCRGGCDKMNPEKTREALLSLCVLLMTLLVAYGALTLAIHLFVDDGMQFNLEMWKYARDIKRISADPLIGHEHTPGSHSFLMGNRYDDQFPGSARPRDSARSHAWN